MMARKTLDLNPHHPVMRKLLELVKESEDGELDEATAEYVNLMFQMALLNSGF
jgi:HSP90 family molecular chaperone